MAPSLVVDGDQLSVASNVVAPVFLGIILLLASVVAKMLLDEGLHETRKARGEAWFKLLFLGPDLCFMALGMLASSQALANLLDSRKQSSLLGTRTSTYFWVFVFLAVLFLLVSIQLWRVTAGRNAFPVVPKTVEIPLPGGESRKATIYPVQYGKALCGKPAWCLVIANLLGVASISLFVCFIVFSFVVAPEWLP